MPSIVDDDDEVLLNEDFEEADDAPETAELEASEPESASPKAEAGEEDEDDKESYSKRVQKRINKLTQKVRQFEQESQFWREKVENLETKSQAKEIAEYQAFVEHSEGQLKAQIEAARAAKKTAIEEGDIDAQIKADENILELREQIAEKRRLASAAKEQATQFQEQQKQPRQPAQTSEVPDHLPDGTKQWLKDNPWFMKGTDTKAAEFARVLDASLQEEGYTPDDPAMYTELDKRLRVLVPRLAKEVKAQAQAKTPPKARVAGSSPDGQRPDSTVRPSRKLTSDDLTKMRRYGFDPNKPEHRKNWLHRNDPL